MIDGFSFNVINDNQVDVDSPIDETLIRGLRDNAEFIQRWLGRDFLGGAVANHDHDGSNSKQINFGDLLGVPTLTPPTIISSTSDFQSANTGTGSDINLDLTLNDVGNIGNSSTLIFCHRGDNSLTGGDANDDDMFIFITRFKGSNNPRIYKPREHALTIGSDTVRIHGTRTASGTVSLGVTPPTNAPPDYPAKWDISFPSNDVLRHTVRGTAANTITGVSALAFVLIH